jgi:hypothetical protein
LVSFTASVIETPQQKKNPPPVSSTGGGLMYADTKNLRNQFSTLPAPDTLRQQQMQQQLSWQGLNLISVRYYVLSRPNVNLEIRFQNAIGEFASIW